MRFIRNPWLNVHTHQGFATTDSSNPQDSPAKEAAIDGLALQRERPRQRNPGISAPQSALTTACLFTETDTSPPAGEHCQKTRFTWKGSIRTEGVRTRPQALPKNMEFMVRSLRSASFCQSVVNSTSACLPSVATSILSVVISKFSSWSWK